MLSLEEAIDNPPGRIEDLAVKCKEIKDSVGVLKNGTSPSPCFGTINKDNEVNSENKMVSHDQTESVLSRWTDRPSIHSFMNAIASLSMKKHQMELQQHAQHNKLIFDQIQLLQQGQKMITKQPLNNNQDVEGLSYSQKQTNQQQQQQTHVTSHPAKTISTHSPNKQASTPTSNAPSETKPKFRKVMEGGVLVSVPVTKRHTPGSGKTIDLMPKADSGVVTNSDNAVGYILDDILARSQENKKVHINSQRKVISKTEACQRKEKQDAISHDTGETITTYRLRSRHNTHNDNMKGNNPLDARIKKDNSNEIQQMTRGKNTVTNSSDGKNISTISMPALQNVDINPPAGIQMSCQIQTDDTVSASVIEKNLVENNKNIEMENFPISNRKMSMAALVTNGGLSADLGSCQNNSQFLANQEEYFVSDELDSLKPNSSGQEQTENVMSNSDNEEDFTNSLVIDEGSDNEINTGCTQRSRKRQHYSTSLSSSESSSEEVHVSVFDRMRNFSENSQTRKNVQSSCTDLGNNKDQLPIVLQEQSSLVHTNTFLKETNDIKRKEANELEVKQTGNKECSTEANESTKRNEFDHESKDKDEKKTKQRMNHTVSICSFRPLSHVYYIITYVHQIPL